MSRHFKAGDTEAYFASNLAFHALIHKTSGNSRLRDLYERYTREQKLFRHFSLATVGIDESNKQHRRIMRALKTGDCDAAGNGRESCRERGGHDVSISRVAGP